MQTLETELRVQTRSLKQIARVGQVAMYELRTQSGMLLGYEVIVIRIRPAEEAFGHSYPERERYPRDEEWGLYGWTFTTKELQSAHQRFKNLCDRYAPKLNQPHRQ